MKTSSLALFLILPITLVSYGQEAASGGNVITSNFYFSTDKSPVIVWAASNVFPATQYPIPSQANNYLGISIPNTIGTDQALSIQNVVYVTDTNITPPNMLCVITENITVQYQSGEADIRNVLVKSENPANNSTGLNNNCTVTSETTGGQINIYVNVLSS